MTWRERLRRLAGSFGGARRESMLREELAFHRDRLEADYRARGVDAGEARRAAAVQLGGATQTVESWRDQRGLPFLETLRQDASYGWRTLRHSPGLTLSILLTLAIGIGGTAAIFTLVNSVMFRPLPYADAGRLVTVGDRGGAGQSGNVGYLTAMDWRAGSRSFDQIALLRSWLPTLAIGGEAERVPAVRVTWNYFAMLGVRPVLGRDFTADDDRPDGRFVVLISDRLWRQRFNADPAVVGRGVTLSDTSFRIIGVLPSSFSPLDAEHYYETRAELWAPVGYSPGDPNACRTCQHLHAFGRLKAGVSVADAQAELNAMRVRMRAQHPQDYSDGSIAVVPLREALTGGAGAALYVLFGAVAFVLLIACANVANLLLARSLARRRELALRAALGAGRGRIVRQLLTESVILSAAGGAAGMALAWLAVRALTRMAPPWLPRLDEIAVDGRVLAFTAVVAVATGLLFGLGPALGGVARAPTRVALDTRGTVGGGVRLRALLVMADLALALVLLAGAGLMLKTMATLARTTPGFNAAPLLSMQFALTGSAYGDDAATIRFQDRLVDRLRAIPGVESATVAGQIPFGGNADCRGFHVRGRMKTNAAEDPCIERYGIAPEYLKTFGIRLLAGRGFESRDRAAAPLVLLVSRATARAVWDGDNPIGAAVRIGSAERGPWYTVVGVVDDVHHDSLAEPPLPAFYTAQSQFTDSYLVAVVKAANGDPAALAGPARAAVRELDPTVAVYQVRTLASLVGDSTSERVFVLRLLSAFAAMAVLLAAIGLYGVVSYGVSQRAREIGLRVALGATGADVVRSIFTSGFGVIAAGLAAGVCVAAVATHALTSLMVGVTPLDVPTFASAAGVLLIVALAAHWLPVRRALAVDPATALRSE